MTKRLYFTCPIKSLYMMKEFGVEFECKSDEAVIINGVKRDDPILYDFADWGVDAEMISDLLKLFKDNYPKKIYVKKKSEHVFEPKEDDAGFSINSESRYSSLVIGVFQKTETWAWYNMKHDCQRWENSHKKDWKIIERDEKQFFTPEVEND